MLWEMQILLRAIWSGELFGYGVLQLRKGDELSTTAETRSPRPDTYAGDR